ncbi:MAG: 3-methyl-2-oxobutanoate dehydrogenase subunit VorB [Bacteroides sp.]|nr:3-methyl-2-oxobutanoate dehydrogenase subunit VorB [Prevotella sp.]MCM1408376.1 3-methyl-2-oxobutanoate dehydrogenase subunit VorB [Treponema brennaborense]MCM1470393.1 3-methyl-2-oxobutanoate dehydrogenase subunit VorB [Bacteroides sp.]
MGNKILIKGNEAIGEAAIRAGCRFYFAYPITPQNEIPAYLAKRMPQVGGTFLQAESELAAINMVMGASAAGARAMTSSSSPGISLKQEGISYLSGAQLPAVVVNMMRGGPGLGNIAGAQGDYFQATRGGGNGDYHVVVIAPGTVQELADYTMKAFDIADRYRVVVMLLGDGYLGQMAEPCVLPEEISSLPEKPWALTGKTADREARIIASLKLGKDDAYLNRHVKALAENYAAIAKNEAMYEDYLCSDADVVLCAYGTSARVCKKAVKVLREKGVKAGLFRPITLWPFPEDAIEKACANAKKTLVVEMSMGQLVQDVRLYSGMKKGAVDFYGEPGGVIPKLDVIVEKVQSYV